MKKYVIVKEKHNLGQDEYWCFWFKCPDCECRNVMEEANYCQDCGIKLRWSKNVNKKYRGLK